MKYSRRCGGRPMIDIHVHILPALDDGPRDMDMAVTMARFASAEGIKSIVATPHVIPGVYVNNKEMILRAVNELSRVLTDQGIPLEVRPGAEYMLDPDLPGVVRSGQALTLNDGGKFLLVELPGFGIPPYAEKILYEIALQGVVPVIAHPERNDDLARLPDRLLSFLQSGALAQVTAGSLTGLFGRRAQKAARYFTSRGWCSYIGSDAHCSSGRAPALSGAFRGVAGEFGQETADLLFLVNPARALGGMMPSGIGNPALDWGKRDWLIGRSIQCGK